jgi:hypothetical protein
MASRRSFGAIEQSQGSSGLPERSDPALYEAALGSWIRRRTYIERTEMRIERPAVT